VIEIIMALTIQEPYDLFGLHSATPLLLSQAKTPLELIQGHFGASAVMD